MSNVNTTKQLTEEIKRFQSLVENAAAEVNAGNERMRPYLEAYANHRDSLIIQRDAVGIGGER